MKTASRVFLILFVALSCSLYSVDSAAQCPMCKISAESNMRNGGSGGKGLNAGILYMLALPYTLVATFGLIWWRNNRTRREDEVEVLP